MLLKYITFLIAFFLSAHACCQEGSLIKYNTADFPIFLEVARSGHTIRSNFENDTASFSYTMFIAIDKIGDTIYCHDIYEYPVKDSFTIDSFKFLLQDDRLVFLDSEGFVNFPAERKLLFLFHRTQPTFSSNLRMPVRYIDKAIFQWKDIVDNIDSIFFIDMKIRRTEEICDHQMEFLNVHTNDKLQLNMVSFHITKFEKYSNTFGTHEDSSTFYGHMLLNKERNAIHEMELHERQQYNFPERIDRNVSLYKQVDSIPLNAWKLIKR